MKKDFVHLHVHTEYSLLDGLSKISDLIKHIKKLGMSSVAITDHGAMYGVIEFYKKAINEGVKPLIGMEAYTTNYPHFKKSEKTRSKSNHLLLIAKNNQGYKNLMNLSSIAHLEGYYYRPRFDKDTLKKFSKGLICTSSCPQGELPQHLINGNFKEAVDTAKWFLDIFGKDYYLELQRHEYEKHIDNVDNESIKSSIIQMQENENIINEGVVKISRQLGIPIIATNDAHYIKLEDAEAQDALVCIATAKNVTDIKRLRFIDTPTFYIKGIDEMYELFKDYPEALKNTLDISKKCDISITLDKWFFPKYKLKKGKTADEEMDIRINEGAKNRIGKLTKEQKKRIDYESSIIKEKGYSTYFLIVSDMARWASENGIITNTRGSAAGSLVSYCLGIININPLDYNLPFERFLTPWRPSPPDIDFDIADDRREEVIKYITNKYGKEKVAQICTFGRMLARGSVRDIARVLGYPYSVGDNISKKIPLGSQGFPMTITRALQDSPDLKKLYEDDVDAKKIIDLAKHVEGNARHISVHAAGLVIAPDEITNYTPIQLDPEGKKVITQYDMDALDPNVSPGEAIGLLKFDLLGLRNLSIMGSAIEIIKQTKNKTINIDEIPLSDEKTFKMLSRGDTMGVFQLSGSGMTKYLKELKPERIEDIMAMVALYRPGPISKIPEYIERKNDPDSIEYFDERMKEYLDKSYGLLVYQDDVFMTAIKIAGYTWEEADKFRKAVGKKIPLEMQKQKDKFINGAVKNGLKKSKALELFKLIEPFSGYGFNKAHAASYGIVAYYTAYLKANYTVEYMCALLTAESQDTDKITSAVNECRRLKIKVLPPDINKSEIGFKIEKYDQSLDGKAIRFGLNAIKNVGVAAIDEILKQRDKGSFNSFSDFLLRVDNRKINKKVIESLIKVGALSKFGKRSALLKSIDIVRSKIPKKKDENQQALFGASTLRKTNGIKDTLIEDIEEFKEEEIEKLEKELLGLSLSAKPISEVLSSLNSFATHKITEIKNENLQTSILVKVAAVISEVRVIFTKRSGQEMAFAKVQDESGFMDIVVFPSIFKDKKHLIFENNKVIIKGKVDAKNEDVVVIADDISTENDEEENGMFYIKIPSSTTKDQMKTLKKVLVENPGNKPVCLVFENNKKHVNCNIKVKWDKKLSKKINLILNDVSE